jgi:hypothetical protein
MQISGVLTASKSGDSIYVNPKNQAGYQHRDDVYPEYGFINQKELYGKIFLLYTTIVFLHLMILNTGNNRA